MEHLIVSEISRHGYLAIFIMMVLESACIPIPSEAIMLFGGALSAGVVIAGVSTHLNILAVALIGTVGNLIGSAIAYWVGRTGGRVVIERWGKYVLLKKKDLAKAESFFKKHGDVSVLISRVLPVIRTFISLPAGIAEMPIFKFGLFTLIGSLPWTFALAYSGYAVAGNWKSLTKYDTPISVIFGLIIIALILWWYIKRRQKLTVGKTTSP
ncbi:DedA family protein [Patescibacteria group bacterium]|jgi:membrane protein DedA with SNARE-associated domain|nr:DedA family protein [Patescibacteria group bacterium]